MKLIFEDTKNRSQCAAEMQFNDLLVQCTFSTSKLVTIPSGLTYSGGELKRSENSSGETVSICQNHAMRLKNAFDELFQNEAR